MASSAQTWWLTRYPIGLRLLASTPNSYSCTRSSIISLTLTLGLGPSSGPVRHICIYTLPLQPYQYTSCQVVISRNNLVPFGSFSVGTNGAATDGYADQLLLVSNTHGPTYGYRHVTDSGRYGRDAHQSARYVGTECSPVSIISASACVWHSGPLAE